MTGTREILDTSAAEKVAEYETAFYDAFARVTSNRLIHQLWVWDYENRRLATRIGYEDQTILVWRDGAGKLHTAIAFNTGMHEFQSAYFGFYPPADAQFEVLTFFTSEPRTIAWLTMLWSECLDVLSLLNLKVGYATTAHRPMRLYRMGGWQVVAEKEIEGERRYFLRNELP